MQKYLYTLALVMLLSIPQPASAQFQTPLEWSHTANLSQSGAASDARLLITPEGLPQVFWWDQFDGLMTASAREDGTWSEPSLSKIRSNLLNATPELFIDPLGMINAFWIETLPSGAGSNRRALMTSQLFYKDNTWTVPRKLADYVAAFDVQLTETGEVRLAYIHTQNAPQAPAGVYLLKKTSSRGNWSQPVQVYGSIYMRLLTPEEAQISLVSTGTISTTLVDYMNWYDPLVQGALLTFSLDQGAVWSAPQASQVEDETSNMPTLIPGERATQVWQTTRQGKCALYQQEIRLEQNPDASPTLQFGALQPIMAGLSACPQGSEHFGTINGQLFWIWGEETAQLSIALRSADQMSWTLPKQISVYFEDALTQKKIGLNDLRAELIGDRLLVVGTQPTDGEVWFAESRLTPQDFTASAPSPWSEVEQFSLGGQAAGVPSLAIDGKGRTHVVWSAASSAAGLGTSMYYAQSSSTGTLGPFGLMQSLKSAIARQPALLHEARRQVLHLVWSGGMDGSLLYSWAGADEVGSSSAWSAPLTVSSLADSSWPQIAQDAAGTLYVLFVVPLNEMRGVYISRSSDGGATWSEPGLVFDAHQNHTPMVIHPTLAVGAGGELHAAWVNAQTPGLGGTLSIQYSRSLDGGETWSNPLILTSEGFSWPRLSVAADQLHLVYAAEAGDRGSIYHRYLRASQPATEISSWSPPLIVPGWREVILPYGLDSSGPASAAGHLYLLAADSQAGILNYAAWQGESWTPVESHSESNLVGEGLGVGAAAASQAGQLSVGWLAYPADEESDKAEVFLIARDIPALPTSTPLPLSSLPTAATITPTPGPSPKPTAIPSPTPDLNKPVQSSSLALPLPPMALGGILVAFLVAAIFVGRYVMKQWFSSRH